MANDKAIWDFLADKIGNPYGAAGLMGNLFAESCLNPKNLQNGFEPILGYTDEGYTNAVDNGTYRNFDNDQAGYGLAQWTFPARKHNLLAYATGRGASIGDLDMQLGFLWHELQGYKAVLDALVSTKSVREASDAVLTGYEKPKDQSEAMKERRAAFGQSYYDIYAVKDAEEKATVFRATGAGLAAFAENVFKAAWVYWYGTCGYKCTQSLYESKKKQYPKHYKADRTARYMQDIREGKMCADCVGLIKAYFWLSGDLNGKNIYKANNCPDKSADGMFSVCTEKGKIGTIPDIPGLVVHKTGHIGVYVGNGYTVEMMGFNYGCRRRKVTAGSWTEWGRLPKSMIAYDSAPANPDREPDGVQRKTLKKGAKGEEVKELQRNLIQLGYSVGSYGVDGEFGSGTESGVKAFQRDHGLVVDGEVGPKTWAALDKALDECNRKEKVVIGPGTWNIRKGPGTEYAVLGDCKAGDEFDRSGETADGWVGIIYKGASAWVSKKAVKEA